MDESGLSAGGLKPYVCPARLKICEARAARHFEPSLLPRRPDFEVELLGMREANVARAYREHAVGQVQLLQDSLGVFAKLFKLLKAVVGVNPFHKFHFVELVEAVEPAHVFAPAARLAAETRSVGASVHRQFRLVESFVAVEVGDGNFGGGNHIVIVSGVVVHLPLFVGELSGGCGACRIHHNRAHKLAVAVLARFV